jgi:3-hydroxybutyryl-CoA dehydrogenase
MVIVLLQLQRTAISSSNLHLPINFFRMKLVVLCTEEQKAELLEKKTNEGHVFVFCVGDEQGFAIAEGDVFFDLINETGSSYKGEKALFINAVTATLKQLSNNCIRINAWSGFLKRETIEIVATDGMRLRAKEIVESLGWKFQFVEDEPGMISPRIIAMIINEAYWGLEDGISSKSAIDTAMKLGTNYPFGPFEWAEKIGLKKILSLLERLSEGDKRYTPSKLLIEEANGTAA